MTIIFIFASALGFIFRFSNFPDTNVVVIYHLAVLIITWLTHSFIFGFSASVLATFAYNYFFAEPYFTFSTNDKSYITTFVTMTIAALITSTLTIHAKQSALVARQKESETKAIYDLTNHLTDAKDMQSIARISISNIGECFSCEAACLCFDEKGMPEHTFVQQINKEKQIMREVKDIEEIKHRMDWLRTEYDTDDEFYNWLILGRENKLGIIRIPIKNAQSMTDSQIRLLRTMIESVALAMDRFRSAEQQMKLREETVKERYRSNLLRAISHDLRTPLSAIIGISEMLKGMTEAGDPRHSLIDEINSEAGWLHSLVENILNLTRLQDGKLALQKQPEAVEEIIDGAVRRVLQRSPEQKIFVNMPDELLIVPMDANLIEQVFINLLDNAVSHSRKKSEIEIVVKPEENDVKFIVRDSGTGIKQADLPHIFQMFYTTSVKYANAGHGIGLGLAICETIVKAHGGDIEARNRVDKKGAEFIFTLPMGG
ncbi:MAG: ATP-binding protein [Oscillospiraceae bacterium]|nr:ATP-binding protein [Oscillospiraceae bacterium]